MGFLENRRHKAEEQRLAEEHMRVEQANRAWYSAYEELSNFVEEARSFDGHDSVPESPVVLKKGERVFLVAGGAHLIQPPRGAAHHPRGEHGGSVNVMKGGRYHL